MPAFLMASLSSSLMLLHACRDLEAKVQCVDHSCAGLEIHATFCACKEQQLTFSTALQAGARPGQTTKGGAEEFLLLRCLSGSLRWPEDKGDHRLRHNTLLSRSGSCPCCSACTHEPHCRVPFPKQSCLRFRTQVDSEEGP